MRHGFLPVDKPDGMTSHDVVAIARRRLSERSIGHLGTLDPAATGLLMLAVGKKALKVVHLFNELRKEYIADVKLGWVSTTYDREGVIQQYEIPMGWDAPEQGTIQRLIADRFTGNIRQVPPAYSAISIGGKRSYDLAREGKAVELAAREVDIGVCEVLKYEYPDLKLRVECGSGTYIRSLAHDLGHLLHCGGYLAALRRTKVGEWTLNGSMSPENVSWTGIIPLKDILARYPRYDLTDSDWQDVSCGRNIDAEVQPLTVAWHQDLPVALLVPAGDGTAHAKKVF